MKKEELEQMKQLLSTQEIPKSLEKEQIKHKLSTKQQAKKKSYRPMLVAVATFVIVFFLIIPLFEKNQLITPIDTTKQSESSPSDTDVNKTDMKENKTDVSKLNQNEKKETKVETATYEVVYKKISDSFQALQMNQKEESMEAGGAKTESAPMDTGSKEMAVAEESAVEDMSQSKQDDFSKTNIQTKGVDEADNVKTDGTYLYFFNENKLEIVRANGEKLTKKAIIEPKGAESQLLEFYLSDKQLILLEISYTEQYKNQTSIRVFDITDPTKPKEVSHHVQDGNYETSRVVDNYLYTFSSYLVEKEPIKNKPETYVPSVNEKVVSADCILIPKESDCLSYLLVTALSLSKPTNFAGEKAILANGNDYYVSPNNIYITEPNYTNSNSELTTTNITKIGYKKGKFSEVVTGTVAGMINNSFSMDEYKNHLRVVTTVEKYNKTTGYTQSNSLYILDSKMKKTGSITNLAPDESIYSARFMGDTGYFVTFRQVDPLFSVDLSNPAKPKILGQLKIPGFSDYLHFYDENLLLGIGRNADNNGRVNGLKLSMFDISDPTDVKEVDKLILDKYDTASALHEHKDVFIHLPKNIFGFYAEGYDYAGEKAYTDYLLFTYTKKDGFKQVIKQEISNEIYGHYYTAKGVSIEDYFYIIAPSDSIFTYRIKNYKKVEQFSLEK